MKNTNLTVKELRQSLKEKLDTNLYNKLGINKMKKEDLLSLYNVTCNTNVSTDITNKNNNKKQHNKQKAVKDNYFDIKKFIVLKKNSTHGGITFNFDIDGFIPKKVFNGIKYSLKSLTDNNGNKIVKYDVNNKLWVFDLKNKDIINNWYKNQINYKKEEK